MTEQGGERTMIAIPVAGGKLCAHFGHCQQFAFFEVDMQNRKILESRELPPPPHQPGLLPRWLHGENVRVVIAGGMGRRAQDIFQEQGIQVVIGAPEDAPERSSRRLWTANWRWSKTPVTTKTRRTI